jgi:hypothetical protein
MRPWVAERVERLREARDDLAESDIAASLAAATAISGGSFPGMTHARAAVVYALTLEELEEADVVVRDLDRGLIDFPSIRGAQEIYLCWQEGEPEIGFWHDPEAGFAGRRPLDDG